MSTIRQLSKQLQIYPRTKSNLNAWEKAQIMGVDSHVRLIAMGIEWAQKTGRLTGTAEMAIRKMKPYETLKLLYECHENCKEMNDVARFINERIG